MRGSRSTTPPMTAHVQFSCGISRTGGTGLGQTAFGSNTTVPSKQGQPKVEPRLSSGDDVELLASRAADVADDHRAGLGVDPEAPRVPEALRPQLRTGARRRDVGIVRRHAVRVAVPRVDTQDRAEERVEALREEPGGVEDTRVAV